MDMKLLQLRMAQAPVQVVQAGNVMDDPVRIYLTIKALLLKFKHHHQLEFMQNTVLPLPKPPIRPPPSPPIPSPVTPRTLLAHHRHTINDLLRLMRVKECLGGGRERMLQEEMMAAINGLNGVEAVLRCYVRLLSKEYERGNLECYRTIEQMMVRKIAAMKLLPDEFDCIAKQLYRLPLLDHPIMELIGFLYDQAPSLPHFHSLFTLFKGISRSHPSPNSLMAHLRICHPENAGYLATVASESDEEGRRLVLSAAEQVAREKLRSLPQQLSEKDQWNLDFIIQALHYRLPLWQELILWEYQASPEASHYLQQHISPFLIDTVQKQDCQNILAIVGGQKREGWMALLMARELLKKGGREVLALKSIRHFLAHHILTHQALSLSRLDCAALLFSEDLRLAGVLLEVYSFPAERIMLFCVGVLAQDEPRRLQAIFLGRLSEQQPVTFKQAYMSWYLMDRPETLVYQLANTMAVIMEARMSVNVAVAVVRGLADLPPTTHLLCTLTRILKAFAGKEGETLLQIKVARCLNILLVRSRKDTLPIALKTTLHTLIRHHLPEHKHSIFQNVPEEVTNDLRQTLTKKWRATVDAA